ncbi:NAD(+) diphosphatase [Methanobrevibacter olleyae]|uniref:NAD(+) diphosphatase n=1 Tax=Methanobrevibacter olleyae TaxID=294671 RepID=A0A126R266_METOL|nr:NAD(+) diphosphatase [Methanobrevibacter olleyae]AMK15725.1 NADH pyrophosphatase NudC [Methanobrevibacter olleyae]
MKNKIEEKESLSIYDNYKLDSEIKNSSQKYYFIFNEKKLLLINNEVPILKDLNELKIDEKDVKNCIYIGEFYLKDCYVIELNDNWNMEKFNDKAQGNDLENNLDFLDLYEVFNINEEAYLLGGRAIQIIDWENNHQYCGRCGTKTITSDVEMAKVCPKCGFTSFTRICPAIITTIIKKDEKELDMEGKAINKVLMAKHSYHKTHGYSLIAGFLEAGESIEEAVKREVKEEVGIEVDDIEYFGSQSWPFPNSLMVGCICKYKSGEIKVDDDEILKAKWFKKEEIETPPSEISIFSKLIKNFKENY